MPNATSPQTIQGVECWKKEKNGIIIKYCSLNYINTNPRRGERPKMEKRRVYI